MGVGIATIRGVGVATGAGAPGTGVAVGGGTGVAVGGGGTGVDVGTGVAVGAEEQAMPATNNPKPNVYIASLNSRPFLIIPKPPNHFNIFSGHIPIYKHIIASSLIG